MPCSESVKNLEPHLQNNVRFDIPRSAVNLLSHFLLAACILRLQQARKYLSYKSSSVV
jgi:hypothetical protein